MKIQLLFDTAVVYMLQKKSSHINNTVIDIKNKKIRKLQFI